MNYDICINTTRTVVKENQILDVMEDLQLSQSTVAGILKRLEKKELIVRQGQRREPLSLLYLELHRKNQ